MDSLNSIPKRILRFSGVQPQVLQELEANRNRLKADSRVLFGENLDVFIKRHPQTQSGTVELVATPEAKSLPYGSGFLRNLIRTITQKDQLPEQLSEPSADIFERNFRSLN